jgi:integrase
MARLTDLGCRKTQSEGKDRFLGDGMGLYLRVRPGGGATKTWLWRFKSPVTGKVRWCGLGNYPALSLAGAREQAVLLAAKLRQGIDPVEEWAGEIERRQREVAAQAARPTIKELLERWEKLELGTRKDKGAEVKRSFAKDVLPFIGDLAIEDIRRGTIAGVLDRVVERGSPVLARALLSSLRQMFLFAIRHEYIESDPTASLRKNDFGKKTERARVLSDSEIQQLAGLLPASGLSRASQAALWIVSSTACRIGELSHARWEHIDLSAGMWRIPSSNAKNGREHLIFLSEFAAQHFQVLRELSANSEWVLPSARSDGHIDAKTITKQIADRQREPNKGPLTGRTKAAQALVLPGGQWRPHDLRRTGATLMGQLGVRPDVIEKCLNHTEENAMVRVYQRQELVAEQREAWRLLGERLELLTGEQTNVIPISNLRT